MNDPHLHNYLADRPGLSGRVILVHGFNVKDGGKGTTDGLRPHFAREGFKVLEFDTGWRFLAGVRFGNAKRARRLARMIQPGDVLVGHSDGCNLINLAAWQLAGSGAAKPAAVVYLNPALDADTQLAPQIKGALVFHTPSDWIVALASKLPLHPWGNMGQIGYLEKSPIYQDGRHHNISYEHLAIAAPGHSGAFKKPEHLARIMCYIDRFIQSIDLDS